MCCFLFSDYFVHDEMVLRGFSRRSKAWEGGMVKLISECRSLLFPGQTVFEEGGFAGIRYDLKDLDRYYLSWVLGSWAGIFEKERRLGYEVVYIYSTSHTTATIHLRGTECPRHHGTEYAVVGRHRGVPFRYRLQRRPGTTRTTRERGDGAIGKGRPVHDFPRGRCRCRRASPGAP